MNEEPDERSEKERFYDDKIAPILAEASELCHSQGLGMIAVVEFEPNGIGTTMRDIGKDASVEMKLLQLLALCRGNIDAFFIQCMKRFDMSQTIIGSFMRKMDAERELDRIKREAHHAARDQDKAEADALGDPRAEHPRDEPARTGASQRGRRTVEPRPGAGGDQP